MTNLTRICDEHIPQIQEFIDQEKGRTKQYGPLSIQEIQLERLAQLQVHDIVCRGSWLVGYLQTDGTIKIAAAFQADNSKHKFYSWHREDPPRSAQAKIDIIFDSDSIDDFRQDRDVVPAPRTADFVKKCHDTGLHYAAIGVRTRTTYCSLSHRVIPYSPPENAIYVRTIENKTPDSCTSNQEKLSFDARSLAKSSTLLILRNGTWDTAERHKRNADSHKQRQGTGSTFWGFLKYLTS